MDHGLALMIFTYVTQIYLAFLGLFFAVRLVIRLILA